MKEITLEEKRIIQSSNKQMTRLEAEEKIKESVGLLGKQYFDLQEKIEYPILELLVVPALDKHFWIYKDKFCNFGKKEAQKYLIDNPDLICQIHARISECDGTTFNSQSFSYLDFCLRNAE